MKSLRLTAALCLAIASPALAESAKGPHLTVDNFQGSLKPIGFVMKEPGYHVWCNSPMIGPDGRCHLFVSRWPITAGFDAWHTRCEIARYEAPAPEGPWTFKEVLLTGNKQSGDGWPANSPHNPSVVKLKEGRYALTFIGNSGGNPGAFPADQKIGMMLADKPDGPWKLVGTDGLVLSPPADPAIWCHDSAVGVNNPALLESGGKFLLYYKAMRPGKGEVRRMSVAIADKVEGPYVFQPLPLTENKQGIEDGYAFRMDGRIHLITTDSHTGGGWIWSSDDGLKFDPEPKRAYDNMRTMKTKEEIAAMKPIYGPCSFQRPQLLLDPTTGVPTYLFTASGTNPKDDAGSRPFVFKIVPPQE
ncbi:MAG: glycoside hydrolase family protein [Luteolibacter sp.]